METDSDDEVIIQNDPHLVPSPAPAATTTPAVYRFADDNLTLLALAKPALARSRLKRKHQVEVNGGGNVLKSNDTAGTSHPSGLAAVPVKLSAHDCWKLTDEQLLSLYMQKLTGVPMHQGASVEEFLAADEAALENLALYSDVVLTTCETVMTAAKAIVQDFKRHENCQVDPHAHGSGEELYTQEQCRTANSGAAQERQELVEAALKKELACTSSTAAGQDGPHLPVPLVYARAVATGNAERMEALQAIAHMLAPDWKLVSKACAIEDAIFRLWGNEAVDEKYRERVHHLLQRLCPEGLPGVFSTARKHSRDNCDADANGAASDESSSHGVKRSRNLLSAEAGHIRGQLWSGELKLVKLVADM